MYRNLFKSINNGIDVDFITQVVMTVRYEL